MKWLELVLVAGSTLVAAVTVVVLYALGVRLTAIAGDGDGGTDQPGWVRPLSYACFGLCGVAVLFGLYLIIPYFSK